MPNKLLKALEALKEDRAAHGFEVDGVEAAIRVVESLFTRREILLFEQSTEAEAVAYNNKLNPMLSGMVIGTWATPRTCLYDVMPEDGEWFIYGEHDREAPVDVDTFYCMAPRE